MGVWDGVKGEEGETPLYVCVQWPTEAFLSDSQTQEGMRAE